MKLTDHLYQSDINLKPITDTYGLGHRFTLPKSGDTLETKARNPREVQLEITSFRGAIGGKHYYANIIVQDISNVITYSNDPERIGYSCFGYMDGYEIPEEFKNFSIPVNRPITTAELKGSKNPNSRFYGYYEGDLVNAFDTEKEAILAGLFVIKEMFTGDWMVEIRPYDLEEYETKIDLSDIDNLLV